MRGMKCAMGAVGNKWECGILVEGKGEKDTRTSWCLRGVKVVECRMSRWDVREYLTKIYGLPVRDVRTEVKMGRITWNSPCDQQYKRAMWKEDDQKFAYVFMCKEFEYTWPLDLKESDSFHEIAQFRESQQKTKQNYNFANSDRKGEMGGFLS